MEESFTKRKALCTTTARTKSSKLNSIILYEIFVEKNIQQKGEEVGVGPPRAHELPCTVAFLTNFNRLN